MLSVLNVEALRSYIVDLFLVDGLSKLPEIVYSLVHISDNAHKWFFS